MGLPLQSGTFISFYLLQISDQFLITCCLSHHNSCIAAIAGLADQKTARTGNVLGIAGVTFGLASTVADMSLVGAGTSAFGQAGLLGGAGAVLGASVASKVGPTELPQTVAAFHS